MAFFTCPYTGKKFASKQAWNRAFKDEKKRQTRLREGKNLNAIAKNIGPSFRVDKKGQPIAPSANGTYRENGVKYTKQRFALK